MEVTFQNIGWESKITQKRATLSISINKLVAVGSDLRKGIVLYSYLARDEGGRGVVVTYLDGERK